MIYINVFLVILNVIIFVISAIVLGRHEYNLSIRVRSRLDEYKKQTREMRSTVEKEIEKGVRDNLKLVLSETVDRALREQLFPTLESVFDGILHHHLWSDEDNIIRRSIIKLMIEEIKKVKNKELNK